MSALVEQLRAEGYQPTSYYRSNDRLRATIDLLASGHFTRGDRAASAQVVDNLLTQDPFMALADFQAALPFMIMSLAVLAFFGSSMVLLVCLMGFYGWERYARIARGLAISASAQGYAAAVVQLGAKPSRVYLRHILPNVLSPIMVAATLGIATAIITESALSFLGLGFPPDFPTWGRLLFDDIPQMQTYPMRVILPGALISLTVAAPERDTMRSARANARSMRST